MKATQLHLAVGEPPSSFRVGLIERAIEDKVEESEYLDWKSSLPAKENPDEFAKDVAMFANARGGMIVYGVKEVDGPSSAAGSIVDAGEWSDGMERRLRQVAYSRIQPPVQGLRFESVSTEDGKTLVAMEVPASPDAPHLVWSGDKFGAPRRDGAGTAYLREADIERAYRERWQRRDTFNETLLERSEQIFNSVDSHAGVWFVAVAVPHQPRPGHLGRVSRDRARQVVVECMKPNPYTVQARRMVFDPNPRAGLRRWRARVPDSDGYAVVEIHDDGGMAFAYRGEPPRDVENRSHVHMMFVQEFVASAVWFARRAAVGLEAEGLYDVRIDVRTALPDPIYFRPFVGRHLVSEGALAPIRNFIPFTATVELTADDGEPLRAVHDMATDLINQGGVADVGDMYLPPID